MSAMKMITGGRQVPSPTDKVLTEHVSDCVVFEGRAVAQDALTSEPVWLVSRTSYDGSTFTYTVQFAGSAQYDQVWDDRTTLFDAVGVCIPPDPERVIVTNSDFTTNPVTQNSIVNITTVANTEQSYALPSGTKFLTIKTRTGRPFRISFALNGTNTSYVLTTFFENLSLDATIAFTVYLQTYVAGDVLEISTWK